ncbi:MAG: hypothetical protein ACKVOT_14275 [Polaromonas sp.]
MHFQRPFAPFTPLATLVAAMALSACGGGSDSGTAAVTTPSTSTPTPTTPVTPTTPTTPTTLTTPVTGVNLASGSITSSSADVAAFSPSTSTSRSSLPFLTVVNPLTELYYFNSGDRVVDSTGTTTGGPEVTYLFSTLRGELQSVTYLETRFERGVVRRISRSCALPCAGLTATKTASGVGIVISLQNVVLTLDPFLTNVTGASTAPVTVNGSVTGEIENGYVYASQLPRSSTGTLGVTGAGEPASQALLYSTASYPASGTNVQDFPSIAITTTDGTLTVRRNQDATATNPFSVLYQPRDVNKPLYFANLTSSPFTETATDYTITLNNPMLTANLGRATQTQLTLSATLNVGKPAGSVTLSGDTAFTPIYNSIGATNDTLIYDFRSNIPTGGSTVPSIQVNVKGGVVQSLLSTSNTGKAYTCSSQAATQFTAQCSGGFSLSADGRTLTFTDFKAGAVNNASAVVTLNGTLVSTGQ